MTGEQVVDVEEHRRQTIREIVDRAPVFTTEQRERLAALLTTASPTPPTRRRLTLSPVETIELAGRSIELAAAAERRATQ